MEQAQPKWGSYYLGYNLGHNGGCPVLVFGITPKVVVPNSMVETVVKSKDIEDASIDEEDLSNIIKNYPNELSTPNDNNN